MSRRDDPDIFSGRDQLAPNPGTDRHREIQAALRTGKPDAWTINSVTPTTGNGCPSASPTTGGTEAGNLVYWQGANYVVGDSGSVSPGVWLRG